MSGKIFFKNYKIGLGILAVFFIILSVTLHLFHNYFLFRLLRGIICYTTLVYLFIAHGKNIQKWLVFFSSTAHPALQRFGMKMGLWQVFQ
jgi:hypothetical protein